LILAAGESSRMGSEKALLPWPDERGVSLLEAGVVALAPFVTDVLVVVGKNRDALMPVIEAAGALAVRNFHPEEGQFSSLRAGLRHAVERDFAAAMISPVDCPPLRNDVLTTLYDAFQQLSSQGIWGVAPSHAGVHGHPLIAGSELMAGFLAASADSNAKEVKSEIGERFRYLEVDDPMVGLNANTPEEYARICALKTVQAG
jgi:molybdenum cofactor cytidylyltransferase